LINIKTIEGCDYDNKDYENKDYENKDFKEVPGMQQGWTENRKPRWKNVGSHPS
jgi:hypothetical protein